MSENKMFCHCGGKIINGHHCENGHIMIRDEQHHAQLRHTAISRDEQLIKRMKENERFNLLLAVEFGVRASERGWNLQRALDEYAKLLEDK